MPTLDRPNYGSATPRANTELDKTGPRVQRMFAQIAHRYDRMNHLLSMNVDHYWRWRTVGMTPVRGSAPILDLCTGTGDLALAYGKRTRGRVPIVGADFCLPMLEIGRQKAERAGLAKVMTFLEADAQRLPFANEQFQVVSVAFGLRNVADTDRGLSEMVRVCQPGGTVAILEFSMPARQPFKAIYGWYFRNVLPRIGQYLARNDEDAYAYLPESVGHFPSGSELAGRMRASGLNSVRFYPLTLGIATLYVGTK